MDTDNGENDDEHQSQPANAIALKMLTLSTGRCPFQDWYKGVKDTLTRQRIWSRLNHVSSGTFGDFKTVGGDVFELRLAFGPGYRIYFTHMKDKVVVLLGGGDKGTQQADIDRAINLWKENQRDAERFQRDFSG